MNIKSPTDLILLKVAVFSILTYCQPVAFAEEFYFDPSLLQGTGLSINLEKLNEKVIETEAGRYRVDLYVNNKLIADDLEVVFGSKPDESVTSTQPCFSENEIKLIQLKPDSISTKPVEGKCAWFSDLSKGSSWKFEMSTLKLELMIPQSSLYRQPRGFIPVSQWDSGILGLFSKHNTNYYETHSRGGYKTKTLWSSINSGTNIGLWQFRNLSNLRYSENNSVSTHRWDSVRTFAQRPLPSINSSVTLGDSFTKSSLFGSLAFNGVKLENDLRMYPQSKRGYAPEIRGSAATTARVIVKQFGKAIYETVVSPGPFVIDDLYNTSGQGDLQVTIYEANGKTSSFTVPYSAVPDSVRPGIWNYQIALGRVRQHYEVDNGFVESVLQHGLSNQFTGSAGLRLAKDYQAYLIGSVVSTQFGAFGVNATYSHAKAEDYQTQSGWRVETSYSRTFDSGTNLMLAAYRYSTSGFRDLQDVLGLRRYQNGDKLYSSDSMNQKNRFSATLTQNFESFGSLSLNASTSDYYSNSSRVTQFQLGYSNSYQSISYSVNVGRQRTNYGNRNNYITSYEGDNYRINYTENTVAIGFSMPLEWGDNRTTISANMNKNKTSESFTTSMSGTLSENRDLSYSLYSGVENYQQSNNNITWGGSLQQNTAKGTYSGSYSQGRNYKQVGLGTSGTLLIHPGGVTYGPYASDTFALVKAKGAKGAEIKNGQGAKIDSFGYAILPSLSPYQYNTVSLDPKGLDSQTEIQGGSQQVVPYAGAFVQVNFATLSGQQVLINTIIEHGEVIPMGSEVIDNDGNTLGMVGQSGQIYVRINNPSGVLFVNWGNKWKQQCRINYQLPAGAKQEIVQLTAKCEMENSDNNRK